MGEIKILYRAQEIPDVIGINFLQDNKKNLTKIK
jgi:hypothetical protein